MMQAQILFLKSPQLVAVREAVDAAVERRHKQVRRLWSAMLDSIGVSAKPSDLQPR
jgi:hypothetical protein